MNQTELSAQALAEASAGTRSAVTTGAGSIGKTPELAPAKALALAGQKLDRAEPIHLSDGELNHAISDLRERRDDVATIYAKAAKSRPGFSTEERVLHILKRASISVTKTGFTDLTKEAVMGSRLRGLMGRGEPIRLALLLGGSKTPNSLKTGQQVLPDLSEWHAWLHFDAIARAIGEIYRPGAVVVPIPDSGLHVSDLGFPAAEIDPHMAQVQDDLRLLGINDRVVIPEVRDLLPDHWEETVTTIAQAIQARAQSDEVTAQRVHDHVYWLKYIINTRDLGLTFEEQVLVGAAMAGDKTGLMPSVLEKSDELIAHTLAITPHYMAVNEAIRVLDLAGRAVQSITGCREHFRVSVHAKDYEPRPRLVFEENRLVASMGLLPMHGVGMRAEVKGKPVYGIGFEMVNRVLGARPVLHSGRFLWFEPTPGDPRLQDRNPNQVAPPTH